VFGSLFGKNDCRNLRLQGATRRFRPLAFAGRHLPKMHSAGFGFRFTSYATQIARVGLGAGRVMSSGHLLRTILGGIAEIPFLRGSTRHPE